MQKRIRDYGINIGTMPIGPLNKITDVEGVLVGHSTIKTDKYNTGCTVIVPTWNNIFEKKLVAATFVHNGYGKTAGTIQVDELGTLETPIALTNTLNVGLVADAVIENMVNRCQKEGVNVRSMNPVVGECNDSALSTIVDRPVKKENVFEAFETASRDFEEGNVGAGTGTRCYGFKGGIGSASRIVELDGKEYTIGVLVQSNYGATKDLMLNGKPLDEEVIKTVKGEACDKGSIMVIVATDIPLTSRQLKRVIKRASVGIARLGSYIGHGSGEVFIGFSTANVIDSKKEIMAINCINEDSIDKLFRACGEATEEAILNSMVCSGSARELSGKMIHSLAEFL